jgi:hypothetical protein
MKLKNMMDRLPTRWCWRVEFSTEAWEAVVLPVDEVIWRLGGLFWDSVI